MSANDYIAARETLEGLRAKILPIAKKYSQIGSMILSDPAKFYFWDLDRTTDPALRANAGVFVLEKVDFPDPLQVDLDLIEYRKALQKLHDTYNSLGEGEKEGVVPPTNLLGPLV